MYYNAMTELQQRQRKRHRCHRHAMQRNDQGAQTAAQGPCDFMHECRGLSGTFAHAQS